MRKSIQCSDLFPGCAFEAEAGSETELLEKVAAHAASEHGVIEISEDVLAKVRGCIRDA